MKHRKLLGIMLTAFFAPAWRALAQGTSGAAEVPPTYSGGFFSVVMSSGFFGFLIWSAIFIWAIALFPIGITSILHAATLRSRRWPLATKLLILGPVFLFILGWLGFIQGVIGIGCTIACGGTNAAILALGIAQSLYSVSGTLFLVHLYLVAFLISFVIIHFKHKEMDRDS